MQRAIAIGSIMALVVGCAPRAAPRRAAPPRPAVARGADNTIAASAIPAMIALVAGAAYGGSATGLPLLLLPPGSGLGSTNASGGGTAAGASK